MYDKILGIDIAKSTFDVALLPLQAPAAGHTERARTRHFSNTPDGFADLQRWLATEQVAGVFACFEATSTYGEALAAALHAAGHTVVRANPYQIKRYAQSELQRSSTDRLMAAVIARFARERQARLPAWTPPDPALAILQDLVRHADDLETLCGQVKNRLERPGHCAAVIDSLTETARKLEAELQRIRQQIRAWVAEHPTLAAQTALLDTITGFAETSAVAVLSEVGDVTRYASTRQAACYAGVIPCSVQSGTSVSSEAHFSPHGNRRLRKALFYPALVAIRHDPRIKAFYLRLRAAGKSKMSAVGAVMHKLLRIAVAILRSGRAYDLYIPSQEVLTTQ